MNHARRTLRPVAAVLLALVACGDEGAHATVPQVPAQPAPEAIPAADEPASAAPDAATADAVSPRFRGEVRLAPEFAELDGRHTLFIMLRSPKTPGGMPLAVKKVELATFPLAFEMGPENVPLDVDNKAEMISGEIRIVARLSVSGKLGGAAGDIEGELLSPPADGLVLNLSRKRTQ